MLIFDSTPKIAYPQPKIAYPQPKMAYLQPKIAFPHPKGRSRTLPEKAAPAGRSSLSHPRAQTSFYHLYRASATFVEEAMNPGRNPPRN